ncbi:MAG: hypothetical protein IKL36_01620 [Clostridia bacterium]|nr:hypothetical protein [Clostridia bacterium]
MKRRSFLKICILIIMFLGLVISSYAENVTDITAYADTYPDGSIDFKDVLEVRKIVQKVAKPTEAADANGDGRINAKDVFCVRELVNYLAVGKVDYSITVYSMIDEHFQDFLKDINLKTITEDERLYRIENLTYYHDGEAKVLYEDVYENFLYEGQWVDGVRVGINYWPIYLRDLEVLGNPLKVMELLKENDIVVTQLPKMVGMLDACRHNPTVWYKCGTENYFLVYSYNDDLSFGFDVYTEKEYRNSYTKKKATITVNGEVLKDDNAVITNDYGLVSLVNLLEELGADIEWVNDYKAIIEIEGKYLYLNLEGKQYLSETDEFDILNNYLISIGESSVAIPVDRDIVVDDGCIMRVFAGIKDCALGDVAENVQLDYKNNIIKITY